MSKGCCEKGSTVMAPCRCCQLVDQDHTAKSVRYCNLCGVMLCDACRTNPLKRIKAFGQQFFS